MFSNNILDIDFRLLVKSQNKYFFGNIFVDEDYKAYFKFGTTALIHDLGDRASSYSKSDLLDIFECHPKIGDNTILLDIDDIYTEGHDLVQETKDLQVKQFCEKNLQHIDSPISIFEKVTILNNLVLQSEYLPNEIPIPEVDEFQDVKYSRKIFKIKNQYGISFYRVTIPKKLIWKFPIIVQSNQEIEKIVVINIRESTRQMEFSLFKPSEKWLDTQSTEYFCSLINNNDGSLRVNIPSEVYNVLTNRVSQQSVILVCHNKKINFKVINNFPELKISK